MAEVLVESNEQVTPPFRSMLTLYFAMMTVGMGQSVVFAILPMLGRELRLDQIVFTLPFFDVHFEPQEMAITSLSALTALVFSLIAPFWGRMSDRFGRKPIIIVGLVGYGIGTLTFNTVAYFGLIGVLGGLWLYALLVLSRFFHATVMSATHPAASSYIVDVTNLRERTKGIGKMGAFNQIGTMIGPVLAWFVSISFLAPLYLQSGIMLIAAFLVFRYLPPTQSHKTRPKNQKRLRLLDSRYRIYVLIAFAIFSMLGMVQQTLGFYYQDTLQLSSVRAAQLFSLAMVVSSSAMLVAQFGVVQRFNGPPIRLVRLGLPFSIAGYLLIANADSLPLLLAAMAFFGLGMGMAGPGYTVSATLAVESHEQGALAGLLGSAAGMGFVVGPIMGGYLYRLGHTLPYWCAASILTLVTLAIWNLGTDLADES